MHRKFWAVVGIAAAMTLVAACGSGSSSTKANGPAAGSTVEIGMAYPADISGLEGALASGSGASGAAPPTNSQIQAFYQALVNYVNDKGGLLGHKIVPVFYPVNALTAAGATTDEAECTDFTQDHHVFAVMADSNHTNTLISCLEAHNVITFDPPGPIALNDATFDQYPLYASAGSLSLTRVAQVEVNELYQQGFFGAGSKVGLVAYNTAPFTQAINNDLKPALASHGLSLADQVTLAPITGISDVAPMQQAINTAVLRFKTEGINRVLFMDQQSALLHPFAEAENTQKYYPRLGFTTNEAPSDVSYAGNTSLSAKEQLQDFSGALAVGWDSIVDLASPPVNSTGTLCNSIMGGAGAGATVAQEFWGACDQILTFSVAVNAGGKLTPPAAIAGLAKATTLQSAELIAAPSYTGGRRDGVSVVRGMSFVTSCQCFQYSTGDLQVSSLLTK